MSSEEILEKVKGIIIEQLGVTDTAVTMEASFIDDLGADSLDIVESSTLPLTEKLMYKVEHEKDKIIVRRDGGKMVIPIDNILFASSIPLDVIHEDFADEI